MESFRQVSILHWTHLDYLARLVEGEAAARQDCAVLRRVKAARFPIIKTLDTFRWDWPKKINRLQNPGSVPPILHRQESQRHLPGSLWLGKSQLATALGYAACQERYSVLFANAIDVINTLNAAQSQGALKSQLRRHEVIKRFQLSFAPAHGRTPAPRITCDAVLRSRAFFLRPPGI